MPTVQAMRRRLRVTAADSKRTGGKPYFVLYPTNDFMEACLSHFLPDTRVIIVVRSELFKGDKSPMLFTAELGNAGGDRIVVLLCNNNNHFDVLEEKK